MSAYIIDTETTGLEPPQVIELAWQSWPQGPIECKRFRPEGGCAWGAYATHHILPEDVKDCPSAAEAKLPKDTVYIIGHNVDYDWAALGKPAVRRICTLAIARKLYTIDSYGLSALYYYFQGANAETREALKNAHGAATDVALTQRLLQSMEIPEAVRQDPHKLWQFSEECRIPTVMSFGKHRGMLIQDLPKDYRRWLVAQPDMDPYVVEAVRRVR